MDFLAVCAVALFAAGLTLFSGFGLGTLLLPAFALFFPVEAAVGATAVVHLANNLFKLLLVGRDADRRIVLRFGAPAALGGFAGAAALALAAGLPILLTYPLLGAERNITPVGAVVGTLIVIFACFELLPVRRGPALSPRWLPVGGLLSGFFGGLSGHQGALRSIFLLRAGLSRDAFIGTSAVCAVIVDCARLLVYGGAHFTVGGAGFTPRLGWLMAAACLAAFTGSLIGARLVQKTTLAFVRALVGILLLVSGVLLAAGII